MCISLIGNPSVWLPRSTSEMFSVFLMAQESGPVSMTVEFICTGVQVCKKSIVEYTVAPDKADMQEEHRHAGDGALNFFV